MCPGGESGHGVGDQVYFDMTLYMYMYMYMYMYEQGNMSYYFLIKYSCIAFSSRSTLSSAPVQASASSQQEPTRCETASTLGRQAVAVRNDDVLGNVRV